MQKVKEMDSRKEMLDNITIMTDTEEIKAAELSANITSVRDQIKSARVGMGGVNVTREGNNMIANQVHVLENRLDKALVKFNEALHINKELREQIDSLRRERAVFDTIYKKLERELQEKKKEMAFIIEVSNIAYEERDNAQSELSQLKLYASKELQSFEETFKELDELLEEDRKMKDAIRARMLEQPKEAAKAKAAAAAAAGGTGFEDEFSVTGGTGMGTSTKKKKNPFSPSGGGGAGSGSGSGGASGAGGGAANLGSGGSSEVTKETLEEAFNKIRAATRIEDVNALVSKFLHSEDDNFSLFNYVNELNNEIEKLEESRAEIKAEIERVRGNVHGQGDNNRRAVLKHLEEKLQMEEVNSRKFQQLAEQSTKLLEQTMSYVDKLFATMECDDQLITEQQGVPGLSENTLLQYLAAVETKTDGLLTRWRKAHNASDKAGPAFPFGSTQITIDIPSTGDDYNDGYSDEDERVLTRTELLAKTNQKIFKAQQAALEGARKGGKRGAGAAGAGVSSSGIGSSSAGVTTGGPGGLKGKRGPTLPPISGANS